MARDSCGLVIAENLRRNGCCKKQHVRYNMMSTAKAPLSSFQPRLNNVDQVLMYNYLQWRIQAQETNGWRRQRNTEARRQQSQVHRRLPPRNAAICAKGATMTRLLPPTTPNSSVYGNSRVATVHGNQNSPHRCHGNECFVRRKRPLSRPLSRTQWSGRHASLNARHASLQTRAPRVPGQMQLPVQRPGPRHQRRPSGGEITTRRDREHLTS